MKRIQLVVLILMVAAALFSCSSPDVEVTTDSTAATTATTAVTTVPVTEEKQMNKIILHIGDSEYTATLYNTAAAKAFAARLPLTLTMQELHGNEKYYYFDSALPAEAAVPDSISTGDLKLYGSDCLVLFYDSFTTSYSYTDIGKIDEPDGLKEALGDADAIVIFSLQE